MGSKKFTIGKSVRTGAPCIIYDGDSLLCEFPEQTNAQERAIGVMLALNDYYNSNYHNLPGMPEEG